MLLLSLALISDILILWSLPMPTCLYPVSVGGGLLCVDGIDHTFHGITHVAFSILTDLCVGMLKSKLPLLEE